MYSIAEMTSKMDSMTSQHQETKFKMEEETETRIVKDSEYIEKMSFDDLCNEIKLLYVAVTRAKKR